MLQKKTFGNEMFPVMTGSESNVWSEDICNSNVTSEDIRNLSVCSDDIRYVFKCLE